MHSWCRQKIAKCSAAVSQSLAVPRLCSAAVMTAPGGADCGPEDCQQTDVSNRLHDSIFVSSDAPVYDVPMSVIHRPLPSSTDENKVSTSHNTQGGLQCNTTSHQQHHSASRGSSLQVQQFVGRMQQGDDFTPIEVLWVEKCDNDYYFAFGGCHRWEAHKRLKRPTIKAKLVRTTPKSLSVYLGRDPFERL